MKPRPVLGRNTYKKKPVCSSPMIAHQRHRGRYANGSGKLCVRLPLRCGCFSVGFYASYSLLRFSPNTVTQTGVAARPTSRPGGTCVPRHLPTSSSEPVWIIHLIWQSKRVFFSVSKRLTPSHLLSFPRFLLLLLSHKCHIPLLFIALRSHSDLLICSSVHFVK